MKTEEMLLTNSSNILIGTVANYAIVLSTTIYETEDCSNTDPLQYIVNIHPLIDFGKNKLIYQAIHRMGKVFNNKFDAFKYGIEMCNSFKISQSKYNTVGKYYVKFEEEHIKIVMEKISVNCRHIALFTENNTREFVLSYGNKPTTSNRMVEINSINDSNNTIRDISLTHFTSNIRSDHFVKTYSTIFACEDFTIRYKIDIESSLKANEFRYAVDILPVFGKRIYNYPLLSANNFDADDILGLKNGFKKISDNKNISLAIPSEEFRTPTFNRFSVIAKDKNYKHYIIDKSKSISRTLAERTERTDIFVERSTKTKDLIHVTSIIDSHVTQNPSVNTLNELIGVVYTYQTV